MAEKTEQKKTQLTPEIANQLFGNERKRMEAILAERKKIEGAIIGLDKTLFGLKEIKNNKEKVIQINLGNGVFLKAKVEDSENVNYMIGSDIIVDKKIEEALKDLEDRKTQMLENFKKIQEIEKKTQQNISQLYQYLNNQAQQVKK
jgi:prefoldin alpha subunit